MLSEEIASTLQQTGEQLRGSVAHQNIAAGFTPLEAQVPNTFGLFLLILEYGL
jgi:hypothetical protein